MRSELPSSYLPPKQSELHPPPANPWVASSFESSSNPMVRGSYRLSNRRERDIAFSTRGESEISIVQLPDCIEQSTLRK